jgi:hypothetical protein
LAALVLIFASDNGLAGVCFFGWSLSGVLELRAAIESGSGGEQ